MSSDPSIRLRGLGKKFKLYDHSWQRLAELALGVSGGRAHWALKDVDLDLHAGDCIGIVGRNGAGKSTLLELVCGILRPSEGSVETRGKIAALLQLGAGFNPEFTGRENVFLGASLYGLSTAQTVARLPAIEAFAGIGDYLDRPVREYSSGMYARLAFSVCANVDADILVVDEILGVGDVRFQQKSMRFLRSFRKRGIVLFVSHNEHAVAALCRSAIWIDKGRIVSAGTTKDVMYRYRREMSRLTGPGGAFLTLGESGDGPFSAAPRASLDETAVRDDATIFDPDDAPDAAGGGSIETTELARRDGSALSSVEGGESVKLVIAARAMARISDPRVVFALRNPLGQVVFSGDSRSLSEQRCAPLDEGDLVEFAFEFRLPFLPTAAYPVDVFFLSSSLKVICHDCREAALIVEVLSKHISDGAANIRMERTELLVGVEVL